MSHRRNVILLSALVLCSSCASPVQRQPEPEAAVRAQMNVKAALLEADRVAAAPIRVEYDSGRLRMTGFVSTEAEKARAEEAARNAVPELEIINDLRVWKPGE